MQNENAGAGPLIKVALTRQCGKRVIQPRAWRRQRPPEAHHHGRVLRVRVGRGRGFVDRRRARPSIWGGFVGRIGGGPSDTVAVLGFVGRIGGGPLDAVVVLGFVGRIGGGPLDGAADLAGASGFSGGGSLCCVGFGAATCSGVGFGAVTFGGVGFFGVAANFAMTGLTSTWTFRTRVPAAVTTRALSDGMG